MLPATHYQKDLNLMYPLGWSDHPADVQRALSQTSKAYNVSFENHLATMPYSVQLFYQKFKKQGYEQEKNIVSHLTEVIVVRRKEILPRHDDSVHSQQEAEWSRRGDAINLLRLPRRLQTPRTYGDQDGKVQSNSWRYQSLRLCSHVDDDENTSEGELVSRHEKNSALRYRVESRSRVGHLLEKNCWNWEMIWNPDWWSRYLLSVQTSSDRWQLLGVRMFWCEVWVLLQSACQLHRRSNCEDSEPKNRASMCVPFLQGSSDHLSWLDEGRSWSDLHSDPWHLGECCLHRWVRSLHLSSTSQDHQRRGRSLTDSLRAADLDVLNSEHSLHKSSWHVQVQDLKNFQLTLQRYRPRSRSLLASSFPSLLRQVQARQRKVSRWTSRCWWGGTLDQEASFLLGDDSSQRHQTGWCWRVQKKDQERFHPCTKDWVEGWCRFNKCSSLPSSEEWKDQRTVWTDIWTREDKKESQVQWRWVPTDDGWVELERRVRIHSDWSGSSMLPSCSELISEGCADQHPSSRRTQSVHRAEMCIISTTCSAKLGLDHQLSWVGAEDEEHGGHQTSFGRYPRRTQTNVPLQHFWNSLLPGPELKQSNFNQSSWEQTLHGD